MSLHVYSVELTIEDIAHAIDLTESDDFALGENGHDEFVRDVANLASEHEVAVKSVVFEDF